MASNKKIIDSIIERQTPTADVISKAAKKYKEEEEARQVEQVMEQLSLVDSFLNDSVRNLQRIRKEEKKAKKVVTAINDAKEQFLKDADYEKFLVAVQKAHGMK